MGSQKMERERKKVRIWVAWTCDVYMYMWAFNCIGLSVESFIISTDYNSKRKLPKFWCAVAEENWGRGRVIFVGINIANNFTWLKWVAICLFLSPCGVVKLGRGRGEKARGKNSGELSALFSFSFSVRLVQNVKISHIVWWQSPRDFWPVMTVTMGRKS